MAGPASKLAILGGKKIGGITSPPFPVFSARAIRRVTKLLQDGRTVGLNRNCPEIREVEQTISDYHGGRHAMVVSSGHAALQTALAGLEIGPGDEVITTP